MKIDASGNKVWDQSFGGSGYDVLRSIQTTGDGGYFLSGSSVSSVSGNKTSANFGNSDYWVLKLGGN